MALSKEEYLKRYLSEGDADKKEKKKRRKKKATGPASKPRMTIVDDDVDFGKIETGNLENTLEDDVGDNEPIVVGVIDERPEDVQRLETFQSKGRWKALNQDEKAKESDQESRTKPQGGCSPNERVRHDSDSDQSPPRRTRHDSDSDQSPPRRKRHDSDSDQSPPRKRGRDSNQSQSRKHDITQGPPKRRKHDSDSDQSPLRRMKQETDSDLSPPRRHDSDQSPPRRRRHDSDQSPPRRTRESAHQIPSRRRHDSDSDQSPPRRRRKDSDQSPPRRRGRNSNSGESNKMPRGVTIKKERESPSTEVKDAKGRSKYTQSGQTAGLQSAQNMKQEARKLKQKEDDAFAQMDDDVLGKGAQTVHRDKSGRRRNFAAEAEEEREKQRKQAEKDAKYQKWGKGLQQAKMQEEAVEDALHEASKPLARYKDDEDLDALLRDQEREGDPMLAFIKKKKAKTLGPKKPVYQGPEPPPNRFNIQPGYRWDGVNRSNGFENKIFAKKSEAKAVKEIAYKWSTEDM